MKSQLKSEPRVFACGKQNEVVIRHYGSLELAPDEMVAFTTESGTEFDVGRKDWGYYALMSVNARVRDHNLRTALMRNQMNRFYVVLVEVGKEDLFQQYLLEKNQELVCWLDNDQTLNRIRDVMREGN